MKTLLLIFTSLVLISCSEDDPATQEVIVKDPVYFSSISTDQTIYPEYPYIENGRYLFKVYAETTRAIKLKYEIIQETIPGAVIINQETGDVTVRDATLFKSDENPDDPAMSITVKVSAGEINTTQLVKIAIIDTDTCDGSQTLLYDRIHSLTSGIWPYTIYYPDISSNNEYTFILSKDMNLCSLFTYSVSQSMATFELIDESGKQIFSELIMGIDDGWAGYKHEKTFNVPLKAGKKYTIRGIAPGGVPLTYYLAPPGLSEIGFPIDLGHMKIVDTGYTISVNNQKTKISFPLIYLSFSPI